MASAVYLSAGWFAAHLAQAADWQERPGVDCSITYEITGTPEGKTRYHAVIRDGQLQELAAGPLPGADVRITYTYDDARAEIAAGDHPEAAYMQGKMKLEGDYARWLYGLRPLLASPEYKATLATLAALTEF